MDIVELVESSLDGVDRDRVDIVDLQPVRVAENAVAGLSAIVSQLAYNATEPLSDEGDRVSIGGSVVPDGYDLLIIDHGVGMSDEFLEGLNLILANPNDPKDRGRTSGVRIVAGLAARHGIAVRLEHADPGVIARVTIPHRFLEDWLPPSADSLIVSLEEATSETWLEDSRPLEIDTEAFLESIFGQLRDTPAAEVADRDVVEPEVVDIRSATDLAGLPPMGTSEPTGPLQGYRRDKLQTRVPGRNYNEADPTPTFTKPSEAAVEIRLALDDFTRGRQAATDGDR